VLAAGANDVRDAVARAEAVTEVRGSEDFLAVCAAFKRMKNIVDQARAKGETIPRVVHAKALTDPAEVSLESTGLEVSDEVRTLSASHEYVAALARIASLRTVVDTFFEKVMVMAPEAEVRANRLALLVRVLKDFSGIADFSEIVTAG
jgi:glycyl-tRNA synthetase beta chain